MYREFEPSMEKKNPTPDSPDQSNRKIAEMYTKPIFSVCIIWKKKPTWFSNVKQKNSTVKGRQLSFLQLKFNHVLFVECK